MVLNDLVIRVKTRAHRGDITITNDSITQAIIDAINDARREIIRLLPKQWLRSTYTFSTVIGQNLYDLPADCQEPVLLRYTSNNVDYTLSKVESEREFYLNVWGTAVSQNKPRYFFDAGVNQATNCRQVFLFPTPDAIYTPVNLTYMMDPTLVDLTVANLAVTIPVFPSYVQDALWKGAYYYFLKSFDDPAGTMAKADYDQAKEAIEEADDRDLDSDLSFRFDLNIRNRDTRDGTTGIRLQ